LATKGIDFSGRLRYALVLLFHFFLLPKESRCPFGKEPGLSIKERDTLVSGSQPQLNAGRGQR
jgi:hypothetical protein